MESNRLATLVSKMKIVSLACFVVSFAAVAAPPEWTRKNGIQEQGSTLTVVTTGSGPSLDLARRSAIDHAKGTAAEQINGSANIQSMSIETEKTASFHSEVSSTKKVEGLTCKPLNEYFEDKEGSFTVWLKCEFDLKKARVQMVDETPSSSNESPAPGKGVGKSIEVAGSGTSASNVAPGTFSRGENRHLILSVIPACESILIRGKQSRSIPCKSNPATIMLLPTDKEVIIRGPAGFAPKHLKVLGDIRNSESEAMEVYLDKM